jgi:hypothetical protein
MRTIAPSMPLHVCPNMGQWLGARSNAMANNPNSSKVYRREGQLTIIPRKPDIIALPRCTSSESFSSCCDSVAALALASCNEHVAQTNISQPHPPIPSELCTAFKAQSSKGRRNNLTFRSENTGAHHLRFFVPVSNCHTEFLTFFHSSAPYIFPLLRAFFPRRFFA